LTQVNARGHHRAHHRRTITRAAAHPREAGAIIVQATRNVTVRSIAFLDAFCKEHDMPTTLSVDVPAAGLSARALAESIGLPLDLIEGIFHNHTVSGLGALVMPGDRVAFVPRGTPASHAAFFGPFITRS
jgi:hypothetical protein